MERTMRMVDETEYLIRYINSYLPGLKKTDIIGYCYKYLANEFRNKKLNISAWNDMMKLRSDYVNGTIKDYPETIKCKIDDEDFDTVITGEKEENDCAYMRMGGIRYHLSFITKLVLLYYYNIIENEKKNTEKKEASVTNIDGMQLLQKVNNKAAKLIAAGNINKVLQFLED